MLEHLRVRTPLLLGIFLVVAGIFASGQWELYYRLPWYDKTMHLLGGITAAWLALALLQDELTHLRAWKQLVIIVSVTLAIGIAWEWAEYASTLTRAHTPWLYRWFHGGDLPDTLADLIADAIGGVLMTAWALYKERR
jgi:uncharacterized membrane protein YjdF